MLQHTFYRGQRSLIKIDKQFKILLDHGIEDSKDLIENIQLKGVIDGIKDTWKVKSAVFTIPSFGITLFVFGLKNNNISYKLNYKENPTIRSVNKIPDIALDKNRVIICDNNVIDIDVTFKKSLLRNY